MPAKVSVDGKRADDRRSKRRQMIIETAARLFASEGYAQCEVERVATEAGIAKGTLYLYFPGKQELFFACVDLSMQQMQQKVQAAAEQDEDPYGRIARGIRAYLAFFDSHPEYVELMIQERAIFRDRKRPTYFEHREAHLEYWRTLYRGLIAAGRMRADLPIDRMVDTVGSLLYGSMFLNHMVGRTVPLEDRYNALLEIMLRGVLSDEERARFAAGESNPSQASRECQPPDALP